MKVYVDNFKYSELNHDEILWMMKRSLFLNLIGGSPLSQWYDLFFGHWL